MMKKLSAPDVFKAHSSHIIDLAFTPDSRFLLSAGMDNQVHQWTAGDWSLAQSYTGHEKSVNTVWPTPRGDRFITASSDRRVLLWTFGSGGSPEELPLKGSSAALSGKGRFLAALDSPWLTLMDFVAGAVINRIKPFPRRTTSLAFHPEDLWLAAGGQGDDIRLLELPGGEPIHEISQAHQGYVLSLAVSPDGNLLISTGYEKIMKFWRTDGWRQVGEIALENQGVQSLAFSPEGRLLAVASDHRLTLVDSQSVDIIQKLDLDPKGVYCPAFSADGRWLALGSADKRIRLWDLAA